MGFKESFESQSESAVDFNLIQNLYRNGNYELSELYCGELLSRDPTNTGAMIMLSSVYFKMQRYDKSEHFSLLAIEQSPLLAEAYSNLGNVFRVRGKLQEALDNYRHSILLKPDFKDGYINLAGALVEAGDIDQAIQTFVTLLHYEPNLFTVRTDLGNLLKTADRLEEAKVCYLKAIEVQPRYAVAWNNLGCVFNIQGEIWLAIHHFEKAVSLDPNYLDAHINLGNIFNKIKIFEKATAAYLRALVLSPNDASIYANLAIAYFGQGMYDLAINNNRRAIELQPDFSDAYCNLGNSMVSLGMKQDALTYYNKALHFNPFHPDSLNNLAIMKLEEGSLEEAIAILMKVLEVSPEFVSAHNNIGVILQRQGKFSDALVYYKEAIQTDPTYVDVYNNMGATLKEMNDLDGALECFNNAISINPGCADAHCNLASLYKDCNKISEAIHSYKVALQLKPYFPNAFCNFVHCSLTICDWTDYDSRMREIVRIVTEQLQKNSLPSIHPHHAMLFPLKSEHRKSIAACYAKFYEDRIKIHQKNPYDFSRELSGRLRIGYVSSDFGNHPTSHLMQSVPGLHDTTKVEIFCYALNQDDGTAFRAKICQQAEHFVDLSAISCHSQAADLIYQDGIHILVNLNGYTKGARSEIFALRPAPIQVMWLGYPDTSGAPYMDYIITDAVTSPMNLSERYSEKLAYMPHTFFIGDHQQMFPHLRERLIVNNKCATNSASADNISVINATNLSSLVDTASLKREHLFVSPQSGEIPCKIAKLSTLFPIVGMISSGESQAHINGVVIQNGRQLDQKVALGEEAPQNIVITTRQQYGLSDDAVIFCNFNQLYKLDPYTFAMWVNIIKNVDNSVLWLLKFPPEGVDHILAEADKLKLPRERIVFSDVAPKEEHVRRGQLADVCLDTPLCNGHTTSMDVLWAGTPVLTLPGSTMASRVASSILCALGCPELVAQSCQEYQDIAIRLGNNKDQLQSIRTKVWEKRAESSLFDCKKYVQDLEGLFFRMWERFALQEQPEHLVNLY